jgi:hypothetical protein
VKGPELTFWHVWTGEDGVSRQSRRRIEPFALSAIAKGAAPQWQHKEKTPVAGVNFSVLPPGWTADWHENPMPQWILPLTGRWFVETMDGRRVEMGPGELSLGEDQETRADPLGRQGHRSGVIGETPAVLMLVQLSRARQP